MWKIGGKTCIGTKTRIAGSNPIDCSIVYIPDVDPLLQYHKGINSNFVREDYLKSPIAHVVM